MGYEPKTTRTTEAKASQPKADPAKRENAGHRSGAAVLDPRPSAPAFLQTKVDPASGGSAATSAQAHSNQGKAFAQARFRSLPAPLPGRPSSKTVQRHCSCGGVCNQCQSGAIGTAFPEQKVLQASPTGPLPAAAVPAAAAPDLMPSNSAGQQLPPDTRNAMERHFRADFKDVRVHFGAPAASAARSINADAYTIGNHIFFGPGQFQPNTAAGQKLLAHELAHVLQQAGGKMPSQVADIDSRDLVIGAASDPLEHEAERHAQAFTNRTPAPAPTADPVKAVRRQPVPTAPPSMTIMGVPMPTWAQLAAAAPVLPPGTLSMEVGYWTFTTDQKQLQQELMTVVTQRGIGGLEDALWYTRTTHNQEVCDGATWELSQPCKDWVHTKYKVIEALEIAIPIVRKTCEDFLQGFEEQSKLVMTAMLQISMEKVLSEEEHYGLQYLVGPQEWESADDDKKMSMAAKPKDGLTKAATGLASTLRRLSSKISEEIQYESYFSDGDSGGSWSVTDIPGHNKWQLEIDEIDYQYMSARAKAVAAFPILASFATPKNRGTMYLDKSAKQLEEMASASNGALAIKLENEIEDRFEDIWKTRQNLASGDLRIWKLPHIVGGTKSAMEIQPGSLHDKLVDENVERVASDEGLIKMALAALAIALGIIAALPTGGASLVVAGVVVGAGIGAAAISAYVAYSDFKEYNILSAANGTDFEKAQAISQEEPSLFWLAVSVVGALIDIGPAFSAFGKLAKAARTVEEAKRLAVLGKLTAEEATSSADALKTLVQDADKIQPGLGAKIEARLGQGAAEQAGEAERLAADWERGLNPETEGFLKANAEARALYAEMDPAIRDLLTHCASICVIPNLTRRQYARIKNLVYEHGAEDLGGFKQFFHFRRNELEIAIGELEEAQNLEEVKALLEHTLTTSPLQAEEEAVATWERLREKLQRPGFHSESRADFIDKYRSGLRYDEGAATWYNPVRGLKDTIPLSATSADALATFKASEGFKSFRQMLIDEKLIEGDEDLLRAIEGLKTYKGRPVDAIRHAVKDLYRNEILARMVRPDEALMRARYPHLPWEKASKDAMRQASYQEMRRMTDVLQSSDKGNLFERWYKEVMAPTATQHVEVELADLASLGSTEDSARVLDLVEGDTIHELKRIAGEMGDHDLSQFRDNMLLLQNKFEVNGVKLERAVYTFPIPEGAAANATWMAERLAASKGVLSFEVMNSAGEIKLLTKASDISKPAFWTWLGVPKP